MDKSSKREILARRHILSGSTVAAILWLTLAPHPIGDQQVTLFPGADKLVHGLMFLTLELIILWERHTLRQTSKAGIWLTALCVAIFGAATEVAQNLMQEGRSFEWLDMAADTTGAFAGSLLFSLYHRNNR